MSTIFSSPLRPQGLGNMFQHTFPGMLGDDDFVEDTLTRILPYGMDDPFAEINLTLTYDDLFKLPEFSNGLWQRNNESATSNTDGTSRRFEPPPAMLPDVASTREIFEPNLLPEPQAQTTPLPQSQPLPDPQACSPRISFVDNTQPIPQPLSPTTQMDHAFIPPSPVASDASNATSIFPSPPPLTESLPPTPALARAGSEDTVDANSGSQTPQLAHIPGPEARHALDQLATVALSTASGINATHATQGSHTNTTPQEPNSSEVPQVQEAPRQMVSTPLVVVPDAHASTGPSQSPPADLEKSRDADVRRKVSKPIPLPPVPVKSPTSNGSRPTTRSPNLKRRVPDYELPKREEDSDYDGDKDDYDDDKDDDYVERPRKRQNTGKSASRTPTRRRQRAGSSASTVSQSSLSSGESECSDDDSEIPASMTFTFQVETPTARGGTKKTVLPPLTDEELKRLTIDEIAERVQPIPKSKRVAGRLYPCPYRVPCRYTGEKIPCEQICKTIGDLRRHLRRDDHKIRLQALREEVYEIGCAEEASVDELPGVAPLQDEEVCGHWQSQI